MCTRATLLKTQGPWLEAEIRLEGEVLTVMDDFSADEANAPAPGQDFEIELSAPMVEGVTWESIRAGNPAKLRKLEPLGGWRYQAYGQVISIDPVVVDCGLVQLPEVFETKDPRVIGEYVAFPISRLDAAAWYKGGGGGGNEEWVVKMGKAA